MGTDKLYNQALGCRSSVLIYLPVSSIPTIKIINGSNHRNLVSRSLYQKIILANKAAISK